MSSLIVDFPRKDCIGSSSSNCTAMMDLDTAESFAPAGSRRSISVAKRNPLHHNSHKAVRFSSMSVLHHYEPTADQSGSAIRTWDSAEEEEVFKLRTKREIATFRRLKQSGLESKNMPSDMCSVGLEQQLISREYTQKRIIQKRLVKLAVRKEQARFVPFEDPQDRHERIAAASRKHSEWARTQAKTIGLFQVVKP